VVYIPLSLSTLVLMRAGPDGVTWIFFILFVVFLGDVGAYYVGTYKGKHRLNPSISPGKTIEGALGGLGANLVVGLVFKAVFLPGLPFLWTAVLVLTMGAAGQAGDLFESEMKRAAGIKDSGNILPGHGGLLDRIDALLFAAPVAYVWNILVF
jgi:phosphatidate cytidylyltransferase